MSNGTSQVRARAMGHTSTPCTRRRPGEPAPAAGPCHATRLRAALHVTRRKRWKTFTDDSDPWIDVAVPAEQLRNAPAATSRNKDPRVELIFTHPTRGGPPP